MAEQTRHPKTIFEQIALGLEVTNANSVAIAEDIASLYKMVAEIHAALFANITPEPNTSGAEEDE